MKLYDVSCAFIGMSCFVIAADETAARSMARDAFHNAEPSYPNTYLEKLDVHELADTSRPWCGEVDE